MNAVEWLIRRKALNDAIDWARSCSGESADIAADYIQEMAQREREDRDLTRWVLDNKEEQK